MDRKIYKSSNFDRVLFSTIALAILIPGVWVILYGISRQSYDWPMAACGILLCSYTIYILQILFTYKVILDDDYMEIHRLDCIFTIKFDDIVDIYERRNACYIIDRVIEDGESYIRGTKPLEKYSTGMDKVKVNLSKLPVLQKAYIENYQDMVSNVFSKTGLNHIKKLKDRKSSFVSAALLKNVKYWDLKELDIIKILLPYIILILTLLMCLVEYGTASKGVNLSGLDSYIKIGLPILVVIGINVLILNFINYFKKYLSSTREQSKVPGVSTFLFTLMNIVLSAGIVIIFFIVLDKMEL
jgi:hypothetical protein